MFHFQLPHVFQANGTESARFKTYRGVKNIHDLGRVIEYDGEPEVDAWDGDECNEIRGTESSIFPPFMAKEDGIWAFEANLCRSMKALYERPSKYRGIPTLRYHLDLGDIAVSIFVLEALPHNPMKCVRRFCDRFDEFALTISGR